MAEVEPLTDEQYEPLRRAFFEGTRADPRNTSLTMAKRRVAEELVAAGFSLVKLARFVVPDDFFNNLSTDECDEVSDWPTLYYLEAP